MQLAFTLSLVILITRLPKGGIIASQLLPAAFGHVVSLLLLVTNALVKRLHALLVGDKALLVELVVLNQFQLLILTERLVRLVKVVHSIKRVAVQDIDTAVLVH